MRYKHWLKQPKPKDKHFTPQADCATEIVLYYLDEIRRKKRFGLVVLFKEKDGEPEIRTPTLKEIFWYWHFFFIKQIKKLLKIGHYESGQRS